MKSIGLGHVSSKELGKINEILHMTEAEIMATKKNFTSVFKLSEKTLLVKDWLDDSIQLVKVK